MKKILFAVLIAGCLSGMAASAAGEEHCSQLLDIALENPVLSGRFTSDKLIVFWVLPDICSEYRWHADAAIGSRRTECDIDETRRFSCAFSLRDLFSSINDDAFSRMSAVEKFEEIDNKQIQLSVSDADTDTSYSTPEILLDRIPLERSATSSVLSHLDPTIIRTGLSRYSNFIGRIPIRGTDLIVDDETPSDPPRGVVPPMPLPTDDDPIHGGLPNDDPSTIGGLVPAPLLTDGEGCTMIPGATSNPGVLLWLASLLPFALRRRG